MISNQRDCAAGAVYDPHGKRDPFTPLVTMTSKESSGLLGAETVEELTIEGIVHDPGKGSVVIVSGSVLKEGEEIGKMKILEIRRDGVVISMNGSKVFKPMYKDEEKENT